MDELEGSGCSDTAIEHANRPRNYGPLKNANGHFRFTGPCGDTMEFWVLIESGRIKDIGFITDGCSSSVACGSMATSLAREKTLDAAMGLKQQAVLAAFGDYPEEFEHCALLAVTTLQGACADYQVNTEEQAAVEPQDGVHKAMARIGHKIAVFSGKGGVGKSTVAANIATTLALQGKRVGLLDIDIHGPSVPTMFGCEDAALDANEDGLLPIEVNGIKLMSVGFLLDSQDDAVIWRGPKKTAVIKQLLENVAWGDLDYLIIDSPPGTGDEPLSIWQLIGALDGAVIVTTPQKVAAVDVRKSISFCRQLQIPVLGIIENMSGFACPKCGEITHILPPGGGLRIADDMAVPFLGSIPMDPQVAATGDSGEAYIQHFPETPTAEIMRNLVDPLLRLNGAEE